MLPCMRGGIMRCGETGADLRSVQQSKRSSKRIGALLALHAVLFLYSFTGILGKMAAEHDVLSVPFLAYYAGVIALLGVYALAWQQVIKHLPLTTAFANKAVTILWGMLWGFLIFGESINVWKALGGIMVAVGVILFVRADGDDLQTDVQDDLAGEDL